jgi:hypothetical protein
MFGQRRSPWFLAALLGVTAMSSVPGPARASIILAMGANLQPGVIACLGVNGNCVYVPATTNPAMAFNGGVEAAMSQNGSFIAFALTLQDTSGQSQYASTAVTSTFANPILIAILGTAGEPVGTPVSLRLNSGTDVDPGVAEEITNQLNSSEFAPNSDQIIGGFHVGDTFGYWASIAALGNVPIVFQVTLSVQAAGEPTPLPAPGTLALLLSASLALGSLLVGRRWQLEKPAP